MPTFGRVATIQHEFTKHRGPSQQIVFIGTENHPLYRRIRAYERHLSFSSRFIRIKFLLCIYRQLWWNKIMRGAQNRKLKTKLQEESRNFQNLIGSLYTLTVKGKAVPLQAWTGPEGSRKLRFPDFVTTAQDGGKVVSLTHRPPLPPGNTPDTHFC